MKITWSLRALAQLKEAHTYIAKENSTSAREFLDTTENVCRLLSIFPYMGIETDEQGVIVFPLVRYRYLIFYMVLPEEIRIIRIRHASQKIVS